MRGGDSLGFLTAQRGGLAGLPDGTGLPDGRGPRVVVGGGLLDRVAGAKVWSALMVRVCELNESICPERWDVMPSSRVAGIMWA